MRGKRSDGIRTVQDLKDRCKVDEFTGCWLWAGATNNQGLGSTWLPALQSRCTLGTVIGYLRTGVKPPKGVIWHRTCCTRGCANPGHRVAGNRSSQMLAEKAKRTPLMCARISAGKRARSKISEEDVQAIRAGTESLRVTAEAFGVSVDYVSDVRRGRLRRPLAAAGSSVFNHGGT